MAISSPPPEPNVDNPYALTGRPIRGLIQPKNLDEVLNQEILDRLAELPLRSSKHKHREYFQKGVKTAVGRWLSQEAAGPSVHEAKDELKRLLQRIETCLPRPANSDFTAIAGLRSRLSASAVEAMTYGSVEPPSDKEIRRGDNEAVAALFLLHGLIPGSIQRRGGRRIFVYHGSGGDELSARHRPRDSRLERLIHSLAFVYRISTGKMPGHGPSTPFQQMVTDLLQELLPGDAKNRGDKAIRRVIALIKAYELE